MLAGELYLPIEKMADELGPVHTDLMDSLGRILKFVDISNPC